MVQWVKMSDIEKVEGFNKKTGEKLVSYRIRVATNEIAIPVGLQDEAAKKHINDLDEEGRFILEEWLEEFMFSRIGEKFDYEILAEEENIPPVRIICSDFKKQGSMTLIVHRDDIINVIGSGSYKRLMKELSKRKKVDPEKVKIEFGD